MKELTNDRIEKIEEKLSMVLLDLKAAVGDLDVEAEFEKLMFSKGGTEESAVKTVRELTRRFGPKLLKHLGVPPAPGSARVRILDDGMRAELDIDPPAGDGAPVTWADVQKILKEKNVIFGVDEDAVKKSVESGKNGAVTAVCIARGVPPTPAKDGRIERLPAKRRPASKAKDTPASAAIEIDAVEKDEKIARLVPPEPGKPGKDVSGLEAPVMAGAPISPEVGSNVSFDANAGIFFAKSSGRVVIDGNRIDVEQVLEIKSDVDISTGNVNFPGEVVVRGAVRGGYSVDAEKDIVIEGGVETAHVASTNGSVFIGKGVQGQGVAMVHAAWDVTARFIEGAMVCAGGVIKTQHAIRSDLAGGDAVLVREGKGVVMGGKIYAGRRVEVRELGAGSGEPTVVHIGITPENLKELAARKTKRRAAQKAMADAEQSIGRFGLKAADLESAVVTAEAKQFLKLAKSVVVLTNLCRRLEAEETQFVESMKNRTRGEVDVRGRVHPGVKILIGPATYVVKEPLSWVRFKYDPDRRRIKAVSLV